MTFGRLATMSELQGRRRARWISGRGLLATCLLALSNSAAAIAPEAHAAVWRPSPGHVQVAIWPGKAPDAVADTKPESVRNQATDTKPGSVRNWTAVTDVSQPTMTVYAPKGHNTGVAVVVFPGGGYQVLAMDLEGTEICAWLTSRGMTCILLKYRVPDSGPTVKENQRYYPKVQTALQD